MRCVICVLAAFSCIDIVRLSYLGLGRVKTLKSESLAPEQILAEHGNNLMTETKLGQLIFQPISTTSFLYVVLYNLTNPVEQTRKWPCRVWRLALQIFCKLWILSKCDVVNIRPSKDFLQILDFVKIYDVVNMRQSQDALGRLAAWERVS